MAAIIISWQNCWPGICMSVSKGNLQKELQMDLHAIFFFFFFLEPQFSANNFSSKSTRQGRQKKQKRNYRSKQTIYPIKKKKKRIIDLGN